MSSLSSGVNSACSVIKVDFVDRFRRGPAVGQAHDVRRAMAISVVVGAVVVLLSSAVGAVEGNLLAVAFKVCNLLTAPLFGLFFMAMFVRRATVLGTHAGAAVGLAVIVAVNFWEEMFGRPGINFLWAMPLGLAAQIMVGVVISRCLPRGGFGGSSSARTRRALETASPRRYRIIRNAFSHLTHLLHPKKHGSWNQHD